MDNGKIISLLIDYINHDIMRGRKTLPTGIPKARFQKLSYRKWAVEELMSWLIKYDEHLPYKEKPSWEDVWELLAATIQNYSYSAKDRKVKNMWEIVSRELEVVKLVVLTME